MSTKDSFQWYKLEPNDAWFFRDGRPMNRGENARGVQSLFPPSMETMVGAFRAALARKLGWQGRGDWPLAIKDVLGDGFDDLGKLAFLGPLLAKDEQVLFPCPKHILISEDAKTGNRAQAKAWLKPDGPKNTVICDLGEISLPLPPERDEASGKSKLKEGDGYYLTLQGLNKVIKGQLPSSYELVKESSLFTFETRVGIERDEQTRTVSEGALYNPTFVRLQPRVSLLMGLKGLAKDWSMPSHFPIGGEARMAICRELDFDPLKKLSGSKKSKLLISLGPIIFSTDNDKPWHGPGPGDEALKLNGKLRGHIQTLSCNRPLLVPSWDSIKAHPRDQLLAVPAGTVWWLTEESDLVEPWQIGQRKEHGYGLVISAAMA